MSHLLIIGGSDAGISAALRAREINPVFDVTVVVADRFPNYSICGLLFFLSGEVSDWHDLAVVEHSATVMKTVDSSLGQTIAHELQCHGVKVNYIDPLRAEVDAFNSPPVILSKGQDNQEPDISQANLSQAKMSGASLRHSDLSQADLSQAKMKWTNINRADFTEAILSKADLSEATLAEAQINEDRIDNANFNLAIMPESVKKIFGNTSD